MLEWIPASDDLLGSRVSELTYHNSRGPNDYRYSDWTQLSRLLGFSKDANTYNSKTRDDLELFRYGQSVKRSVRTELRIIDFSPYIFMLWKFTLVATWMNRG